MERRWWILPRYHHTDKHVERRGTGLIKVQTAQDSPNLGCFASGRPGASSAIPAQKRPSSLVSPNTAKPCTTLQHQQRRPGLARMQQAPTTSSPRCGRASPAAEARASRRRNPPSDADRPLPAADGGLKQRRLTSLQSPLHPPTIGNRLQFATPDPRAVTTSSCLGAKPSLRSRDEMRMRRLRRKITAMGRLRHKVPTDAVKNQDTAHHHTAYVRATKRRSISLCRVRAFQGPGHSQEPQHLQYYTRNAPAANQRRVKTKIT